MILALTPQTLAALAARADVAAAFPFLGRLARPVAAGCCPGSAPAGPDWKAAAAAVFSLPPDRRAAFKALTGAATVTRTAVKAGRVVDESF